MASKELRSRIRLKRDYDNDLKMVKPVLMDGELVIADMDDGSFRIKVGDGKTPYTALPFNDEKIYSRLTQSETTLVDLNNGIGQLSVEQTDVKGRVSVLEEQSGDISAALDGIIDNEETYMISSALDEIIETQNGYICTEEISNDKVEN